MNLTRLARPYLEHLYGNEISAAANVEQSQRALLDDLLQHGRYTRWGAWHNLQKIGSYEKFAERIPLMPYEDLRPWVMRMINGEADVLWPGVTRRYAQSSGTSDGKSKYIPITDRSLKRGHYAGASFALASYVHHYSDSRVFSGKNFILGGSYANELSLPPGVKVGDLSATLIDNINPMANLVRIPSKEIALMADWKQKLPLLVEASLHADVRSISGVPSWFLTVLKEVISAAGATTIHDVWPNLEVFLHGGIAFGPYREQYRKITDPARMRYWENYNASEGFFAVQTAPDSDRMRLLLNTDTFYEFIPIDDPDAAPMPLWEVERGGIYAMVITSSNGLWRYPIGDTVSIENLNPIEIKIAGRTKHFINAFGEEVMVYNTDAALQQACAATGAEVLNYTAAPVFADDKSRGHHQWLIEFAKTPADMDAFAELLDKALQDVNSDYQAKRAGNIFLDRLTIERASAGLFDRWLASTGKLGGQRKVPRLANDRRFIGPMLEINKTI